LGAAGAPLGEVRPDGTKYDLPPVTWPSGSARGPARQPKQLSLPGPDAPRLPSAARVAGLLAVRSRHRRQTATDTARQPGEAAMVDLTPDGKHIAFDRTRENSDVVLIERPKQ